MNERVMSWIRIDMHGSSLNNYQVSSLQFRLAYVSTGSSVADLIDHPKEIVQHYLWGYFLVDLFVVFPLPQVNFLPCHFLLH